MLVDVLNIKGEKTGRSVELDDALFNITPNEHVVYLDVKQYLNNWRQGTHKAKQRNEISGSTRKLRKQKGGGGARVGSIKNPLFRGGGRIHGPQPRDYGFKLNKKEKDLARRSAFSSQVQNNGLWVIEDFEFAKPKTKDFIAVLDSLQLTQTKTLTIVDSYLERSNVVKSISNIPNATVLHTGNLNTYHVLNAQKILVMESAVSLLTQSLI
jgi:large subunit ribosomal protein L4